MTEGKTFAEWFYDRPVSPQSRAYLVDDDLRVPPYVTILNFANFSSDVNKFFESLGVKILDLPHEKKTIRKSWEEYYDSTMIKVGSDEFALDISLGKELGFL